MVDFIKETLETWGLDEYVEKFKGNFYYLYNYVLFLFFTVTVQYSNFMHNCNYLIFPLI